MFQYQFTYVRVVVKVNVLTGGLLSVPKWNPIPYIVHYFGPAPYGPGRIGCHLGHGTCSKVVQYIGNGVLFGDATLLSEQRPPGMPCLEGAT